MYLSKNSTPSFVNSVGFCEISPPELTQTSEDVRIRATRWMAAAGRMSSGLAPARYVPSDSGSHPPGPKVWSSTTAWAVGGQHAYVPVSEGRRQSPRQ